MKNMRVITTLILSSLAVPAVAESPDWSGFYAGAQIGWGDVVSRVPVNRVFKGDGAIGGLHAGYNWDFGGYVLGVEADFDIPDITVGVPPFSADIDEIARLKLRAGTEIGSNTLLYGTVGLVYIATTDGGTAIERSDTGWLAGVGLDHQMEDGWVVGGDLLYHQFNDYDSTSSDVDVKTIRIRVSYAF